MTRIDEAIALGLRVRVGSVDDGWVAIASAKGTHIMSGVAGSPAEALAALEAVLEQRAAINNTDSLDEVIRQLLEARDEID
jgi:hypothetical protein